MQLVSQTTKSNNEDAVDEVLKRFFMVLKQPLSRKGINDFSEFKSKFFIRYDNKKYQIINTVSSRVKSFLSSDGYKNMVGVKHNLSNNNQVIPTLEKDIELLSEYPGKDRVVKRLKSYIDKINTVEKVVSAHKQILSDDLLRFIQE